MFDVFGESVDFNAIFRASTAADLFENLPFFTRYFELRLRWVAFENLLSLTRGFKLR